MQDPFERKSNSSAYDVEFSVPMVHRLRFTEDLFGRDFGVLEELLVGRDDLAPTKVLVWLDQGLAQLSRTHSDGLDPSDGLDVARFLQDRLLAGRGIQLVLPPQALPGGERVKNEPQLIDQMLRLMDQHHLDRRSYVVAVGGGAVLDAVGYAAAIAHRGIRLIRVPSTTLAQGDSGVGVKNAVNWFGKKNWKGTFATPWAVINDRRLLSGLSDRDFRSGFSEAVKVALLKDPDFFAFLCQNASRIGQRHPDVSSEALRRSVLLHLQHITRGGDPFEALEARPLDFGHWSAHKLESLTNYEVRHGEAVAVGVAVDAAYSYVKLGLSEHILQATLHVLTHMGLPLWHAALDDDRIFDGLEEFRQHLGGRLTITLIRDVGCPVDVHAIDRAAMRQAIALVKQTASQVQSAVPPSHLAGETAEFSAGPKSRLLSS